MAERKYACFLQCNKNKHPDLKFLDIEDDDNHGTKLKIKMKEFENCKVFIVKIGDVWQLSINDVPVPVEYKRGEICSIRKCIIECSNTIINVLYRTCNITALFNLLNTYDCPKHKMHISI
jgi:hypothetical protein